MCTTKRLNIAFRDNRSKQSCESDGLAIEIYPTVDNQIPCFTLVDELIFPSSSLRANMKLSPQQQQTCFSPDYPPYVAYINAMVGWGVVSARIVPKGSLLFPYYGEFISTKETIRRHRINDHDQVAASFIDNILCTILEIVETYLRLLFVFLLIVQVMNYILTIREHIPASTTTTGGVLVSNIDASKMGSLAR
jgi:hypothetical protein